MEFVGVYCINPLGNRIKRAYAIRPYTKTLITFVFQQSLEACAQNSLEKKQMKNPGIESRVCYQIASP
jgi:hypothetical protein